jgi:hypothetical protein
MLTNIPDLLQNRTASAVGHLGFEDLGLLERLLRERGRTVRYLDVVSPGRWTPR